MHVTYDKAHITSPRCQNTHTHMNTHALLSTTFHAMTVDALNLDPSGATVMAMGGAVVATPAMLILGYTLARVGASFCSEARNAVFATVSPWSWLAGWVDWHGVDGP